MGKVVGRDDVYQCIKCNKIKPKQAFQKDSRRKNGIQRQCRKCKALYDKEYAKRKKEHKKHVQRKYLYGITKEEYETLLLKNNNKCHICSSDSKLHVDHCHSTGKVRGMLCHGCNTSLGLLKESKDTLNNMINYLENNNGV